jgi:hypothetical protein
MGPTALLPLRRKACWGLFRPKNPTAFAGCEPPILSTKGQDATSRPPKPRIYTILHGVTPPINHNFSVFPISCHSNCIIFCPFTVLTFFFPVNISVSHCILYFFLSVLSVYFCLRTFPLTDISLSLPLPSIQQYLCHCFSLPFSERRCTICPVCRPLSKSGLPLPSNWWIPSVGHFLSIFFAWLVTCGPSPYYETFDPVSTATRGPPGVFVFSVVTSPARSEYQIRTRNCAQVLSISDTSNALDSQYLLLGLLSRDRDFSRFVQDIWKLLCWGTFYDGRVTWSSGHICIINFAFS